jgi:hypothetical protein
MDDGDEDGCKKRWIKSKKSVLFFLTFHNSILLISVRKVTSKPLRREK